MLAELAKGRMRAKLPELTKALTDRLSDHHAFLLQQILDRLQAQEAEVADLDAGIEQGIATLATQVELLFTSRSCHPFLARPGRGDP